MSTRRNDITRSARIVVQQRTHEGDVAGDIIERGGYVHLNLPTEFGFEGAERCRTSWTVKATNKLHTWSDPRLEVGELLNPARFDAIANDKAKLDLGDYQYAAQHGQNPTPPKGQIFQAQWMKYYGNEGKGQPPIPDFTKSNHPVTPMLSLDCTFKEHKDTDYVAGLCWAMFGADIYLMPICIHRRLSFTNTIDAVAEMVGGDSLDKEKHYPGTYPYVKIKLVEDKANGTAIIDTLQHRIPGMLAYDPRGASKSSRAQAVSWRFRAGNIFLPDPSIASWITEYVYELCAFPKAKRDDYVDATSQALLFIGGDGTIEGVPTMTTQDSKWFGFNGGDYSIDSESVWGSVGGSIWRRI
jgi:predicted phage terminase large subunit-like protein